MMQNSIGDNDSAIILQRNGAVVKGFSIDNERGAVDHSIVIVKTQMFNNSNANSTEREKPIETKFNKDLEQLNTNSELGKQSEYAKSNNSKFRAYNDEPVTMLA